MKRQLHSWPALWLGCVGIFRDGRGYLGRLRRSIGRVPPTPKHGARAVRGAKAMVATDEELGSRAGVEI